VGRVTFVNVAHKEPSANTYTDQVQPKPFGLGQCPMSDGKAKRHGGLGRPVAGNQRTQSAGQVLAINCSESRRVFVSFVSCRRLCAFRAFRFDGHASRYIELAGQGLAHAPQNR